jgi:hypothetical protein
MMGTLVTLIAVLLLVGCAQPKPPAPRAEPPPPAISAPATTPPPAPAPVPAPQVAAPAAPAAPATPATTPAAPVAPAPDAAHPQVLYVKTHLANFREGVGTSRKILRVLRQGARLQVLESRASWLRVRLDDGQEGWIAESVTSATAPVTPARAPAPRSRPSQIARA